MQAYELDALLSSPFASDLTAASGADVLAWVVNERGVRNLWSAAGPDYEPTQVTAYVLDDGQALSGLTLSPDGAILYYIRGGGPNSAGAPEVSAPEVSGTQ